MEEKIKEFLFVSYFGSDYLNRDKQIEMCINRAYRDLCRTIHYTCTDEEKNNFKKGVNEYLSKEISFLLQEEKIDKEDFDRKHEKWCDELVRLGNKLTYKKGKKFTYGQAQKWINMSFKNMIVVSLITKDSNLIKVLHIPIDSIVIEKAKTELGMDKPNSSWSNWDNYKKYKNYQDEIRKKLSNCSPIEWEFEVWNKQ